MSRRSSLSSREITLLAILAIAAILSILAVPRRCELLMIFPPFRALAEKSALLDLNGALIRYKMATTDFKILNPNTPLPVVFEIIRPYLNPQSPLLYLSDKKYYDLLKSTKSQGSGVEYIFCQYKSATYTGRFE